VSVCLYLLPLYPGEFYCLSFPAIAYGRAEADSSSLFFVVHHVREAIPALPMSFAFPNACLFASLASYIEVHDGVSVDSPNDVLSTYDFCNHYASPEAHFHKRMECRDNNPNLCHSNAICKFLIYKKLIYVYQDNIDQNIYGMIFQY